MSLPRRLELVRVSGDGQAKNDTPADQRKALDKLRANRPCLKVVERIEDGAEGLSGALSLEERPDLLRLRALSEAKAYDELAVQRIDRLTRHEDPVERALILSMVRKAGAIIVEADGSVLDPRTQVGELTWVMKTIASAEERIKIRDRTMAGRQRRAAEGYHQGRSPYARTWVAETKSWQIDVQEMKTYRRIFDEVLAGKSLHQVAAGLNKDKIPTPRWNDRRRKGGKVGGWVAQKVRQLIYSRAAIGELSSEKIVFKCPEVVTRDVWKRAIEAVQSGRRTGRPPSAEANQALIRGLAVCGICGSRVWVRPSGGERGGRYYVCRYARTARNEECRRCYSVSKVDADAREVVLSWLEADVLPETGKVVDPTETIKALTAQLKRLDEEERRLLRASRKASNPEAIEETLAELTDEKEQVETDLAAAKAVKVKPPVPAVDRELRKKYAAVARKAPPDRLRELLLKLLEPGDVQLLPGGQVQIRASAPRS